MLDFCSKNLYYIRIMTMRNWLNLERKQGYKSPYISPVWMIIRSLIVVMVLLCLPASAQNQPQESTGRTRNVLVINSYRPTYDWARQTIKGIEGTLRQYKDRIEIKIEYMNSRHFDDEKHYKNLYELYKHKATFRKYDVIIAADDNALRFVLQHRDEIYPNVPVVFCGIQEVDNVVPKGYDFLTGVYEDKVFEPTLQLALKFHPYAKQVVIVSDGTVDRTPFLHEQRLEIMQKYRDRIQCVTHFLQELTTDELLGKIGGLGRESIIIFTESFKDPDGNLYAFQEEAYKIEQRCKVPIYTMAEEWFGLGPVVGGYIVTGFLQGRAAAEIAVRILDGEKPAKITPPPQTPSKFMFDYNQLKNFGITLADLPEGSTVINRPKSFYREHKKMVWATVTTILFLTVVTCILFVNTILRTRAEKALRQSEQRFRTLVSNIPGIVYRCANDPEWTMEFISDEIETVTGYPASDFIKNKVRPYVDIIHPDDRQKMVQIVQEGLDKKKPWTIEFRLIHKDGNIKWLYEKGQAVYDQNGQLLWLDGAIFDITDRKKAEEDLKESQRQQIAILNTIPDIAWLKDKNSVYIAANIQYVEMCGIKPRDIIGKTDFELWPEDLATKYVNDDKEVIKSGKRKRVEEQLQLKQGKRIWIDTIKTPIYDDKGQVVGTSGIARDITEHKEMDQKLHEAQEKYRLAMEATNDALWDWDIATNQAYRNPRHALMLGYDPEELSSAQYEWEKRIHPDDREKVLKILKEVLDKKREHFELEYRLSTKSGGYIWILGRGKVVEYADDDSPLRMVGTNIDITERKFAEEKLRESEQRFRTIFDSAIDGLLLADLETKKFFAANQACCKMLGYTNQELTKLSVKDIHPKNQLKNVLQDFERQIRREINLAENVPVKRKDGSIFYADINTALLTLAGKTYIMGVFRDVTKRKQAEQQLELYREKMARAEQLASLGTISATLSHELNQPLTAIRLFIENSLAKINKSQQPPAVTDGLKDSLKEVETAASIVDRFRNFARQSSEKDISQVDIKTVARRILALLNEAAQRANVSLTCKNMDNLPPVYLNEKDLEQLLFALIENAIQAADGKKHKRLTISGNVKNGMLELKFADNCNGIPPENLDKIFEPFFTTKPPGEGTGLGLCIIQRILSGYGGKIRVDSKPGKGSTFYTTLPLNQNNTG